MTEDRLEAFRISAGGITAGVIPFGATLTELTVPGRAGPVGVVLGFDNSRSYRTHGAFFGAVVGRCANRIARGRARIGGKDHQLDLNENGRTHLHGGSGGFFARDWAVEQVAADSVLLSLVSPDGDQGYPGEVRASCLYRVEPGRLVVEMEARTDRETLVNLAAHPYFNLDGGGNVLGHRLRIAADAFTPVDADNIPTGEIRTVAGSRFDFRQLRPIHREGELYEGYDHNFALAQKPSAASAFAARIEAARSGVVMEVWTTEPGLQFYDGGGLPVCDMLRGGVPGVRFGGLCLEPQRFPDAVHHPGFPDAVLKPDERYRQITEYRFQVR
ncbi:aldose epimerase family protein [Aquamicrobium ahrensii]|uniref:Aldose 1-epimerase n=1 Tax=Aquamicrobium ahrensii TaxID=469551 RepID=A0ABV2KIJ1_9HYPH